MPILKSRDAHDCLVCGSSFKRRDVLRDHLTLPKASDKKPRCPMLSKVIPSDVWSNDLLPFYRDDAPLPNFASYKKRKTGRQRKPIDKIRCDKRTDRLSLDGLVNESVFT